MNNDRVFLNRMKTKIEDGEYDQFFTLPFMTRKLFFANIKSKIEHRIETGGTPVMSDIEIQETLSEMKETSGHVFHLMVKSGILAKVGDKYELTPKGLLALNTR